MHKFYILLHLFIFSTTLANVQTEFESYSQQQTQRPTATNNAFQAYKKKLQTAFEHYKKQSGQIWGNNNISPQPNNWISIHGDMSHRSIVNFEQGIIDIEIAICDQQNISMSRT